MGRLFQPFMYRLKKDGKGRVLNNTRISNTTYLGDFQNLTLSDNIFIGHYNFIEASNGIQIDEGVQITNYVSITTHSSHMAIRLYGRKYSGSDMKGYVKGSISIGRFSFIGPHVLIMPGTKIGKGCIVKAFSLLKGDYPDFSVIGGNPAVVTGDTRKVDQRHLRDNELLQNYNDWTED